MKLISKANYLLHFYAISNSRTALLTRQPRANTVLLQALHSWTHLFSVHRTCVSLCCALTLTKNLRGGLVFLDDHMSSPRRNIKHLKVTLSSSSGGRSGGVRKEKTETVTLADTQTLGLQRWTSQITTSSDRFALRRCLESEYRKGENRRMPAFLLTVEACGKRIESSRSFISVCRAGTAVLEQEKILPRMI